MKFNQRKKADHKNITQSALLMSAGTFISRILGLFRDMAIGSFFSRTETDAFFVAFRIPNFFRRFLGEGALSISFIPVFIQCLSSNPSQKKTKSADLKTEIQKDSSSLLKETAVETHLNRESHPLSQKAAELRARNLMNSVYTILLVFISALTVLGIVFMDPLLRSLFAGSPFAEVEGKVQMAVTMARFLFAYLFLVTLYAYFMGIANALGRFFIPALAPASFNICMIISSFLPQSLVSIPPLLLCWGVLAGGAAQVILTAALLFRLGFLPRPGLSFSSLDLKIMGSRFLPGLFGVGGFAIIGLLNLYFAGWLEEGTHTYIYYGDRLLELPRSVIAISLGTALLPGLSLLSSRGEKEEMLKTAADQRDILLFLTLPCALALYFLGLPIVEALFQRGRFDSLTAEKTALVLKIYSLLLISSSLSRVLATCFYAIKNTWYPALCSCLYVLFHWLFTPYMIHFFDLEGLIGATVVSNWFFMCLLLGAYPFFIGRLYLFRTFKRFLWSAPTLTILALYLCFSFDFSLEFLKDIVGIGEKKASAIALSFVVVSSIALYFSIGTMLRLPQIKKFLIRPHKGE